MAGLAVLFAQIGGPRDAAARLAAMVSAAAALLEAGAARAASAFTALERRLPLPPQGLHRADAARAGNRAIVFHDQEHPGAPMMTAPSAGLSPVSICWAVDWCLSGQDGCGALGLRSAVAGCDYRQAAGRLECLHRISSLTLICWGESDRASSRSSDEADWLQRSAR